MRKLLLFAIALLTLSGCEAMKHTGLVRQSPYQAPPAPNVVQHQDDAVSTTSIADNIGRMKNAPPETSAPTPCVKAPEEDRRHEEKYVRSERRVSSLIPPSLGLEVTPGHVGIVSSFHFLENLGMNGSPVLRWRNQHNGSMKTANNGYIEMVERMRQIEFEIVPFGQLSSIGVWFDEVPVGVDDYNRTFTIYNRRDATTHDLLVELGRKVKFVTRETHYVDGHRITVDSAPRDSVIFTPIRVTVFCNNGP